MKRFIATFIFLVITISIFNPEPGVAVSDIEQIDQQLSALKKEKESAEKQAKEVEERIVSINEEKQKVTDDITLIMEDINESAEKMRNLQSKIGQTEDELTVSEEQLSEAIARVEESDTLLQTRLRLIYMNGNVSYLDLLFNSANFTDFLNRFDSLRLLIGQDKLVLTNNKEDRKAVAEEKEQMETILVGLTKDYKQYEVLRQQLLTKEKRKQLVIASLNKEQAELEDYNKEQEQILLASARKEAELNKRKQAIREEAQRKQREEALRKQREEALSKQREQAKKKQQEQALKKQQKQQEQNKRKQAIKSKQNEQQPMKQKVRNKVTSNGKYIYPLPKKYILTSDYGPRVHPITGRKGTFHAGLDFGAPGGTDVIAMSSGSVIVASWYGGYGNTVIIDHGDGIWSLYAHLRSLNVSTGDTVSSGEKVGEVGSTGNSTGNHLHFEVRINEDATDPKKYIGL